MNELRVTAAYFIKESDLTKAAKLQLMNFLENEATDAQVMALLLDGKVQVLDEMAETIVYDRWDAALLDEGSAAKAIRTTLKDVVQKGKEGWKAQRAAIKAANKVERAALKKGTSKKGAKTMKKASLIRRYGKINR